MPLYEYQCDECGHTFEKIQKFSDPLETTCPKCGGPLRKLMSSPAIQFKGSGWYITDYAKKDAAGGKAEGETKNAETPKDKDKSDKGKESTAKPDSTWTQIDPPPLDHQPGTWRKAPTTTVDASAVLPASVSLFCWQVPAIFDLERQLHRLARVSVASD